MSALTDEIVDVLVAGSGAGALAAAVTAAKAGLKVLVVEKDDLYGGTTARSGGVLWVPCNSKSRELGVEDSLEAARTYMEKEAGPAFDAARADAFLKTGPEMVDFFERETAVKFLAVPEFSDYHPNNPGGLPGGRSILAAPFDASELGEQVKRLRPPLRELTFVGMMFNASQEIAHFFNVTRSFKSAVYVARRLAQHTREMLVHGRPQRLTNGNALAARLARSAFDAGIEIRTACPVVALVYEGGRVCGAKVRHEGKDKRILARHAVVLGTGGFPQSPELRKRLFPHAPTGKEHFSPAPQSNAGDGWRLAEAAGGTTGSHIPNTGAWIPVSLVTHRDGTQGVFPHLVDRYKPGIIAVVRNGKRFVNEANSYHDFGQALQRECKGGDTEAWLMSDHRALRRYGLGFAKPFPLPIGSLVRSGYLIKGRTVAQLAERAGIDAAQLVRTVEAFNGPARRGEDPEFGKGSTAYNRYLGDHQNQPNPCVAPLEKGPFYAVRVVMGDLGTFAGVRTDAASRVLDSHNLPVPGLFAVGNDALSVMGGAYPGGGITLGPAMTFGYIAGRQITQAAQAGSKERVSASTEEAITS